MTKVFSDLWFSPLSVLKECGVAIFNSWLGLVMKVPPQARLLIEGKSIIAQQNHRSSADGLCSLREASQDLCGLRLPERRLKTVTRGAHNLPLSDSLYLLRTLYCGDSLQKVSLSYSKAWPMDGKSAPICAHHMLLPSPLTIPRWLMLHYCGALFDCGCACVQRRWPTVRLAPRRRSRRWKKRSFPRRRHQEQIRGGRS